MKSMLADINNMNEFYLKFQVKNYKTFNDKVVVVEFADGTKTKAVCDREDSFSLDAGIAICLLKKAMGGSDKYNQYIRKLIREHEENLYNEAKKHNKTCKKSKKDSENVKEIDEFPCIISAIMTTMMKNF